MTILQSDTRSTPLHPTHKIFVRFDEVPVQLSPPQGQQPRFLAREMLQPLHHFFRKSGLQEGQIPAPEQQCLAPIPSREKHSWRRTFRVVLSATGVKKNIRFKCAESFILLEQHPNESVCHFRTRINVEFPSHTHTIWILLLIPF